MKSPSWNNPILLPNPISGHVCVCWVTWPAVQPQCILSLFPMAAASITVLCKWSAILKKPDMGVMGSESERFHSLSVTQVGSTWQVKYHNTLPKQGGTHFYFCTTQEVAEMLAGVLGGGRRGGGGGCNLARWEMDFFINRFLFSFIHFNFHSFSVCLFLCYQFDVLIELQVSGSPISVFSIKNTDFN